MRVIFLDIDGVCNTWFTYGKSKGKIRLNPLEPELVKRVWDIAYKTDAEIVISSAWRCARTLEGLQSLFASCGVDPHLIIDKTPDFKAPLEKRWVEIAWWLNKYQKSKNITDFVILDDIYDFDILRRHHVCCDDEYGLTLKNVRKAIKILKSGWMVEKKEEVA